MVVKKCDVWISADDVTVLRKAAMVVEWKGNDGDCWALSFGHSLWGFRSGLCAWLEGDG
jgi:hypothetical protein